MHSTDLRGAGIQGGQGVPRGTPPYRVDGLTATRSHWSRDQMLASTVGMMMLDIGTATTDMAYVNLTVDRLHRNEARFAPDVLRWMLSAQSGLTLTFDSRLHRLDPAAFEVLISELFGADTDVTVEERSPAGSEGPSFIRMNGSDPELLAGLAQAFYDRVWRAAAAEADRAAIERMVPPGYAMVLTRLDALREAWSGATINHPAITNRPPGAIERVDPAARIADLNRVVAEENRVRALEQLVLRLFAPGTLHGWVEVNFGVEVASELPGPAAPHSQVAAEAVVVWGRRGLIGAGLFERLSEVQVGAEEAVWGVAGKWGVPRGR